MSTKTSDEPRTWDQLIHEYRVKSGYQSRTCRIFDRQSPRQPTPPNKVCPCGRLVRRHSFDGESLESKGLKDKPPTFVVPTEFQDGIGPYAPSAQVPFNVYGALKSTGCKFLRIDSRCRAENLYQLICADCAEKPSLILSVYGGAKYFTLTERLEKEFIRGIIDTATMAGKHDDIFRLQAGASLFQMPGFSLRVSTMVFPN